MEPKHVVVLGAGLAGLSAAYHLARDGIRVTVLEKSDRVGGLARSYERDGFTYDYGPHRFHTPNEDLAALIRDLLGDNLGVRDRQSRICMDGRFFDYPLKLDNLLRNLPIAVLLRSCADFLAVKLRSCFVTPAEDSFESWVLNRYGRTLYRKFFGVYTEKTWGIPCTRISADWAAQRITLISLWDAAKKTVFRPRGANQPRTYVSKFWYPRRGGIGMISRRLAEEVEQRGGRVVLGAEVCGLDAAGARIEKVHYLKDGAPCVETPDAIVSTLPITLICGLLNPGPPAAVLAEVGKMAHRSMVFIYLALARDRVTGDHWIYLPDAALTVHRLSEFKNFSEHNAPAGKTLLCCEITCNFADEIWNMPDDRLREIALQDLGTLGLIRPEEVLDSWSHRTRFAYPIYDLEYAGRLQAAKDVIQSFENLHTAGRQGLFKYNNMDHSLEMGIQAARDLVRDRRRVDEVASGADYFG
ncbi:MAG: FAD-dependent oxidoreductase [Planctomycetes bacterium]|nr:FAD-dependent oxidoreductase [Planctomycetota bacterium]